MTTTAARTTSSQENPWRQPRVLGLALLIAVLYFLNEHSVYTSLKVAYTLSAEEMVAEASGGNMLRRVAFLVLAAVGVFGFFHRKSLALRTPNLVTLTLLTGLAWCWCSVLWSVDPSMTLRRLFVLTLAVIAATGIGRAYRWNDLVFVAMISCGLLVLAGVGCELALGTFRPWSGDYRFSGSLHPNTQGVYLAVVAITALGATRIDSERRWLYWFILALAVVLLLLTKSRTSTAGTLLVLTLLGWLMHPGPLRWAVPGLMGLGLATVLLSLLLTQQLESGRLMELALLGRGEESESFSGRTTIWPALQPYIQERYWLGHGYDSFWTPAAIEDITRECQWPVREAHCAYLETWLHLGIIGLVLLLLLIVGAGLACLGEYVVRGNIAALCWGGFLLNGLFNGMFESGMVMIALPTFWIMVGIAKLAFVQPTAEAATLRARSVSDGESGVPSLTLPALN